MSVWKFVYFEWCSCKFDGYFYNEMYDVFSVDLLNKAFEPLAVVRVGWCYSTTDVHVRMCVARPQWVEVRCSIRYCVGVMFDVRGWFHCHKNIERHIAHTIVSWPNPKQWVIVHTSDLMMIIRQSIYKLSIITRGVGKLKTHSPTYCIMDCIMDHWENMLNLTHALDKIYLTGIL